MDHFIDCFTFKGHIYDLPSGPQGTAQQILPLMLPMYFVRPANCEWLHSYALSPVILCPFRVEGCVQVDRKGIDSEHYHPLRIYI